MSTEVYCICTSKNEDADLMIGVVNLAFLKPELEILAFFQHLQLFLEIKSQTICGFFSFEKA